jgi:signal transduction histidine kinase
MEKFTHGEAEPGRGAMRIALLYAVVAGLWILFSDELLAALVTDPHIMIRIAIFKGWLFVLVTAGLLNWLIKRYLLSMRAKDARITSAIRSQFDQMSTIFDSLNALVYVSDLETNELLYMNRYGTSLTGSDWHGKRCYEVLQPGRTEPCTYCTNEQLVRDGAAQPDCVWEFRNPLTGRWYQCIDRAIRWTDGRLVRLEIAVDISERKQMEQMKDEILSAVSHEMRTPLTAMLGFTELILETEVDPAIQKTYLSTVHKETQRLSELITNFLDLQQLQASLVTYRFAAVPVRRLLEDAVAVFAFDQERHHIVLDCPSTLPPVRGDESRLHQVFTNLISNAIKYSPPGSTVTIDARAENGRIVISVQDEGEGIPVELREKIFEKFFRLDNTDRRLVGGTGLGLALVRELVSAHDGKVWVESTVGKGSTFHVSLPAGRADGEGA